MINPIFKLNKAARLFTAALCAATIFSDSSLAFAEEELEPIEKTQEERRGEFIEEHTDENGIARPDLWIQGVEHIRKMKRQAGIRPSSASKRRGVGGVNGVQWKQIGPAPLRIDKDQNFQGSGPDSGEVVDIAIDPRNATDKIIYIATNNGGIWKTTDGGATWKPKGDFMPSLSMGAVILDPGNPSIVYAGTGNPFDGGGQFTKGVGIYKSLDGGDNWSIVGAPSLAGQSIIRMVMPSPGVLLVASTNGVFRSIDGGLNFGNNAPSFNNTLPILASGSMVSDIDLDTLTPTTVYASVNGGGLFMSTDSGATWPTNLFSNPGAPAPGYGYVAIAQSQLQGGVNNNQIMYATVEDNNLTPRFRGLFKTIDGGANWTGPVGNSIAMASENGGVNGCQCGYDQTIGVDPQDPNRVYMAFQELYLSTDGGTNFGTPAISRDKIHWDHHAVYFSPQTHWAGGAPTRVYFGTDGGIHRTDDGGANFDNINETIATNIFFDFDMGRNSAVANQHSYGGTQDCGTVGHRPGDVGTDWHLGIDGDGGQTAVDHSDPLRVYGTDNFTFIRSTDGGNNWELGPAGTGLNSGSIFEVAVDPNNTQIVYVTSGSILLKSVDQSATFQPIATFSNNISQIAMSPIDSNLMWVAINNRIVTHTTNINLGAGATWTPEAAIPGAANLRIRAMAIDPVNTDQVVVGLRGFTNQPATNRTGHLFRTTDNGATWTDIGGTDGGDPLANLPDLPIHSVVIDPDTTPHGIIVSTDASVLRTSDEGKTWQILGLGLPYTLCRQLQIDPTANPTVLRVATYGRSVFELAQATTPLIAVNADLAFGATCTGAGTATSRVVQVFNVGALPLTITSFVRSSGSTDFALISGPATPVTIPPGGELDWTIRFTPSAAGAASATFQITSNDPITPITELSVTAEATAGRINAFIAENGNFGEVCVGSFADLPLTINNTGACDLHITNITAPAPFRTASVLSYPITVAPNTSVEIPVRFRPTAVGTFSENFTIASDDLLSPVIMVPVTGTAPGGKISVTPCPIEFGTLCKEDSQGRDKDIHVCNVGKCPLTISAVSLPSAEFTLEGVPTLPTVLEPGACFEFSVKFTPTSIGDKDAVLSISSDDPLTPVTNCNVHGNSVATTVSAPQFLAFDPTVVKTIGNCFTDRSLPIINTGTCNATVTTITITGVNPESFSVVGLGPEGVPATWAPGEQVGGGDLRIRFQPLELLTERFHQAIVNVTYISDPFSLDTTTIAIPVMGEAVKTGFRMLVRAGGVPVETVALIKVKAGSGKVKKNLIVKDASRRTIIAPGPFNELLGGIFHAEFGGITNSAQTITGNFQVAVTIKIGKKKFTKTKSFESLDTCSFNRDVVIDF